jgi:hypothetical protein
MKRRGEFILLVFSLVAVTLFPGPSRAQVREGPPIDSLVANLTHPDSNIRREALTKLGKLGDRSAIPALIELLRFDVALELNIASVLEPLSGQKFGDDWGKWVEWLEKQKDIRPNPGFVAWKSALFQLIDPAFGEFLYPGVKHRVRIEEIVWGGVIKDGIPALTNPRHVKPSEATYLTPDELVLGLSIKEDHRAYPLRIMDWHEMANDVVGGTPITISY